MRLQAPPIVTEGEKTLAPKSIRDPAALTDDAEERAPQVYSQLRRRDDSFRYLENNLMEVTFSGKIFIKQGTIYSYSGNLTFWVKPQREQGAPPLVIVSGTGRLLLTDREREITVLQVNGEEIFVEPSHLLACQDTLTPRYASIEREGAPQPRMHVLAIAGTGLIALSVQTKPLVLTVTPGYPVNVSSADVISWSGDLTPTIVEDQALAELMSPHSRPSLNVRLEGAGESDDGENGRLNPSGQSNSSALSSFDHSSSRRPSRSNVTSRPLRRMWLRSPSSPSSVTVSPTSDGNTPLP